MNTLVKWSEARRIYRETRLYKILPRYIGTLRYWGALISVIVLILIDYLLSLYLVLFPVSNFSIYILLITTLIMLLIIYRTELHIQKKFSDIYTQFGLKSYPFFTRKNYLSYIYFKYEADKSEILEKKDIKRFYWANENTIKEYKSSLVSPIFISVLTPIAQNLINFFFKQFEIYEYTTIITIFIVLFIVPSYAVWNIYKIYKNQSYSMYKQLKSWSLDK